MLHLHRNVLDSSKFLAFRLRRQLFVYAKLHEMNHIVSDFAESAKSERVVPDLLKIRFRILSEVGEVVPYSEGGQHVSEVLKYEKYVPRDLVGSIFVAVYEDADWATRPIYMPYLEAYVLHVGHSI